jgi:uncharacterized protein
MNELYKKLCDAIRPLQSVAVGFSGGVDSAVVTATAAQTLGVENVLAVTADSESLARRELEEARWVAEELGVTHKIIRTAELECADYSDNPPDRCFFCKEELWRKVRALADERGLKRMADGVNADDVTDHRPGIRAGDEAGVAHPLAEAGMTKEQVRSLARALGLSNWDKPAQACLSSRFPYGEKLTDEGLRRVEAAEEFLRKMGFTELRVRSHGSMARIEVPEQDLAGVTEEWRRKMIVEFFKGLGFGYVSLDLQGLRSGSMNEVL